MVDQREGFHSHEFIMSEANGTRSRLVGVVTAAVGGLEAGTIMGRQTSDGTYVALDMAATDGSEIVSGILLNPASEGTTGNVIFARDGEVAFDALTYPSGANESVISTINSALDGLGIFVLTSGRDVT